MLAILVIPHSNADAERVFSLVRRNDTDFRPMGLHLLESSLVTKIDNLTKGIPCYEKNFSSKFLRKAKSSTYNHLNDFKNEKVKDNPDSVTNANDNISDILRRLDHQDQV